MSEGNSPPGPVQKKPPLPARRPRVPESGEVEIEIDWEELGLTPGPEESAPPPSGWQVVPAKEGRPPGVSITPAKVIDIEATARGPEEEEPTQPRYTPAPAETGEREPAGQTGSTGDPPRRDTTLVMTKEQLVAAAEKDNLTASSAESQEDPFQTAADQTTIVPIEELLKRRAAAGERRAKASGLDAAWNSSEPADEESAPHTKMLPMDVLMSKSSANAPLGPRAGLVEPSRAPDAKQRPPAGDSLLGRVRAGWRSTSLPRKASLIIMPFLFALVAARYLKPTLLPKPPRRTAKVAASASARAALPAAPPSAKPASIPVDQAPAVDSAEPVAPQSPGAVASGAQPDSDPKAASLQRMAADAVAEGNFAAALELYRRLAREQPETQAYREAARILEERETGLQR